MAQVHIGSPYVETRESIHVLDDSQFADLERFLAAFDLTPEDVSGMQVTPAVGGVVATFTVRA